MRSLGTALGLVAVLGAACDPGPAADAPASPGPTTTTPAPAGDGPRAGDLEVLADAFARLHPDPPDLDEGLADLQGRLQQLTPEELLVAVMDLTAGREGDGHSGVFPVAQPELGLMPLQLYDFDDGWRVVAAMAPYEDLVGGEVTAVGGMPVDDVAVRVAPLVSRDDDASLRGRLPQYLVVPAVLAGLGLDPSLTVDGDVVRPDPVPVAEYATWLDLFDPLVCPPLPRAAPPWAVEARDGTVVARFGRTVPSLEGRSAAAFAQEVRDELASTDDPVLVLDLRDNPGGDNAAYAPLLDVAQQAAADRPDAVRLLVNRCTFSAAAQLVAEVLATTDATVVGETMGGTTRLWGDARTTTLPASGIVVHVATRWHERGGTSIPMVVAPDVRVPVTWADRVAGRDPALDAAIGG